MAYQYQSARVRGRKNSDRWRNEDVRNVTLDVLMRDYRYVFLTLTNPVIQGVVYLDLAKAEYMFPTSRPMPTLGAWLASLGDRALPTQDEIPESTAKIVRYSDAVRAGYQIERTNEFYHPAADRITTEDPDIVLTRDDKPYLDMYKHCLATVNGAVHAVAAGPDGFYIPFGGVSAKIAKGNAVGLISFKELGSIKTVPITKDMLFKTSPKQRYRDTVNLQINEDTEGKTVIMVIGGYMHVIDEVYRKTGENLYAVDMANFHLFHRYSQMRELIDTSVFDLDTYPGNETQVTLSQLYSDETIEKLFTLPQSFIVILDSDNVYTDRHYLEKSGLNGKYFTGIYPNMPAVGFQGTMAVYWPNWDWNQWVISIDKNLAPNLIIDTTDWGRQASVSDQEKTIFPWFFARPYFLEIGTIK